MAPKLVITGASGKIGGAILKAILDYELFVPSDLVIATSSRHDSTVFERATSLGVTVRQSDYNSVEMMTQSFRGCERLFLVSTLHIALDFRNCAQGGREKHHFNALEAAKQAGIRHVYYTSLAFQDPSKAAVMRAHLATEHWLKSQNDLDYTILREGIYSESWPLYLGHFQTPNDNRDKVIIGFDGPITWTSIEDLGLANALIITDDCRKWSEKTLYLSAEMALSISDVAALVQKVRGKTLSTEITTQQEYVKHYSEDRGMDPDFIQWWSTTYAALQDEECKIEDSLLEDLLAAKNRQPVSMEQTIIDMFRVKET